MLPTDEEDNAPLIRNNVEGNVLLFNENWTLIIYIFVHILVRGTL